MSLAPLCYLLPGYSEILILLVIGLLLFGRRLPEVGRSLGRTMAEFRRGLHGLRQQVEQDQDVRDITSSIGEVRRTLQAPGQFVDPGRLLENLTDETRVSPGPDAEAVPPPAGGPFPRPGQPA
jgi:TatA/E family protein of Tat protein translocase